MQQVEWRDELEGWIEQHEQQMVEDLISLVGIRSVSGEREGEYPYGSACAQALDQVLELSRRYGLVAMNHQYHCGTALLPGQSDEQIGIFTHMDIVPEGDNWLFDPYRAIVRQGCVIGRGASDNKGPAVMALYVLRFLKEAKISLRHSVQLFFGCDEEIAMRDLSYYLKGHRAPRFSLAPDCAFPVCHGEKGILHLKVGAQVKDSNLVDITGGTVCNIVPSFAYALLDKADYNEISALVADDVEEGISVFYRDEQVGITAEGVPGHVAFPTDTVNAIQKLASFLDRHALITGQAQRPISFLASAFGDVYGKGMQIACEDAISGPLTCVGCVVRLEGGWLTQDIDIRYPITADQSRIIHKVSEACANGGMTVLSMENDPPSYVPVEDPAVQRLNAIANQVLGQSHEPYVMGGGTYARKLPNAVGFGAGLRGPSQFGRDRGDGHQPDECIRICDMKNAIRIYVESILELDQML